MANYQLVEMVRISPVGCPCGQSRRAFTDDEDQVASLHVVDVTTDSRTHYHKRMTELYHVLEGEGVLELDGEEFPISPGWSALIKPGCRHRAIPAADGATPLRILNVPVPAFDPDAILFGTAFARRDS